MKNCIKCKKLKPLDCFWKRVKSSGLTKNNLSSYCKDCQKIKQRECWRKSYNKNPEKYRGYSLDWYRNHRELVKQRLKQSAKKIRKEILQYYGGIPPHCACCGESVEQFLVIDHINNDGNIERKQLNVGGGSGFYFNLRKRGFPKGYQVLCYNCNMAKAFYGRCPHGK